MNIHGKTIWQQAAGDTNRNYVKLCLDWDVILNGPGENGCWPDCEESLRKDKWSERKITDLRRFCEGMKCGDLVVLRLGTSFVYGVGQIVGGYKWCEAFNDVDGWDIGHVRRVLWLWKSNGTPPKKFDTYTLKLGDTTQRLGAPDVERWLRSLETSQAERTREMVDLPKVGKPLDLGEISEHMFDHGVASNSINSLLEQIGELTRIANWYHRQQAPPSENETISYLVAPLLRSLGWTPQKMAIEWNRIDIALFANVPREEGFLSAVVEVKKINASSLSAFEQAERYARQYKNCNRVILTDGLRYGVFWKDEEDLGQEQKFRLRAYMNLTSLRDNYPIHKCEGAKEALLAMGPEWDLSK